MRNLLSALLVFCGCAAAADNVAIAIRNAKIVTVSGSVINKGTVVVRNGLIQDVGESVTIPGDAVVIDGEGLTVYPGLVDALSTWGMPGPAATGGTAARGGGRGAAAPGTTQTPAAAAPAAPPARGPEDRPSTTSWIKAADEIQTSDKRIESARSAGFTTAAVWPTRGFFAGQGSLIDLLTGEKAGEMVLVPSLGQYISLTRAGGGGGGMGGGFPSALMGAIAYVRQIYLDADHYQMVKAAYEKNPRGMQRPEYDRALEGVIESKRILLPANRWVEIDRMIHFAAELKQPAIYYGLREGFEDRSVKYLKDANATVLVSLKWPEKARDQDPEAEDPYRQMVLREKAPTTPAVLKKNGIKFALYSDGIDAPRDLQRAIKKAIDNGLSREDALRALTLSPAEIYGVQDRLGSIEKGKIANLVVTKGEIFDDRTKIEFVLVDGNKYIPAPEAAPAGRGGGGAATTPNSGVKK
ncbi:MAG TPA: amidohydrolase family protein [Bryobacteraceae bacterium]|jgi:imidazolonepropionase-like amidohydrolase|nr:amidohydrolase family protein [Bryobacteraceae bacterium]